MEVRVVGAGNGWLWIVQGFALFRKNPLLWIVLLGALFLLALISWAIPLVGPLVFHLLSPVFLAGLALGCKALEAGEELEIAHLFAGFRKNTGQLIAVGGIYLVGQIFIAELVLKLGGSAAEEMLRAQQALDPEAMMAAMEQMMPAMLAGMALSVPLLMAVWFAPLLIVFRDIPALAALRLSFSACLKNTAPFLLYGVALLGLLVLAMIPFFAGLLVFVPVSVASAYASYQDIFPGKQEQSSEPPSLP